MTDPTTRLAEIAATDPVTAAAERLRRYKFGDTAPYEKRDRPNEVDLDRIQVDRHFLADAYLAEHRADDAELVDVDWLRSVGFGDVPWRTQERHLWRECPGLLAPFGLWFRLKDMRFRFAGGKPDVAGMQTRGAVRRLCAALGLELTE